MSVVNIKQDEMIKNTKGHTIDHLKLHLKDLMLTLPTLLIILNRKEEALYCLERCIIICEKYKYTKTKAKLILMIASIYLNDKHKSFGETWEKAHEAMNLFLQLHDEEGKAETHFLLGMICRRKPRSSGKQDSLKLKKQSKSDHKIDFEFESNIKLHKSSSSTNPKREDEMSYLETSRQQFFKLGHKYGMARVSLAIAIKKIEQETIENE